MTQSNLVKKTAKTEYPFPIRVLISASPAALVMLPLLWATGYPPEEWPFVSGIFALSLIGSRTLTGYTALLAAKWVHRYARSVAAKLGIELEQPENQAPRSGRGRMIMLGITSLLATASWGLALYILALVMAQTGMAPIGTHFSTIALTTLAAGGAGFTLIIGALAGLFYTVARHPASVSRFSKQFRNWMIIAGDMRRHWQIPGVPTPTGRMS